MNAATILPLQSARHTRRHAPTLLVLAGLLGLSACTTTGNRTAAAAPVTPPARWQQPAETAGTLDTAALARWWERFQDPTLPQLVTDALQNSPDVRTAAARIQEARARQGIQQATLLPSVSASASSSYSRSRDRRTDAVAKSESAGAAVDASWQLDLFGRQRQELRATTADLAQARENFYAAQVSLAAEVASTYVSLRAAEADLAVVRQSVQSREQTLQLTRWQQQAGTGSGLDTHQAATSLEQAQAALPSLQQTITEARNQLALLCGQSPGTLDIQLAPTSRVPAAPGAIAVGIPADTLRQRPDVRAAWQAVEAAVARTSAARRERLPTLALSGSVGVDALRAGTLFSPVTSVTNALASLSLPLFSAGSIRQTIEVQASLEQQALLSYQSTVLTALAEVENALASVQHNADRLAVLDRAVVSARATANLARQQYRAGQIDFLTVLDAERTLLGVEEQQVSTTASLTTAHIQLYKALGGGWTNL